MNEMALRLWEVPPDCEALLIAPVEAEVEVEWDGQQTEMWVRTLKIAPGIFWIYAQKRDEPTVSYVVWRSGAYPLCPESWKKRKTPQELSRIAAMAAKNQQFSFARFLFPGETQNVTAIFSAADWGWIDIKGLLTPFALRRNSLTWDSPRLYDWLLKQWQKPDSEVRFAWQWSQWSQE